jgi:putative ABC transport system permease protein
MRFLPLVWAALRRKPVRSVLVFLSVTVAFTLFGLMIGLSDTMALMEARAHPDRIWTLPRFDINGGMPVAVAKRIARMPGVKNTTVMYYLQGYVGDPKNHTTIFFLDDEYGRIFPDWGPTTEQWDMIRHDRTAMVISRTWAARYHKKAGDTFTLIAPDTPKADGTRTWSFKIAAVGEESSQNTGGYAMANYAYFDESLPVANRGRISEVDLQATDPAVVDALAAQIDKLFANSGNPVSSQPEKLLYVLGNNWGGVDVNAVTRDIALVGLLMILYLTSSVLAKSVRERLAEFATLKSFGFSDGLVIGLVAAEATLPCLAGAALGVALAGLLARQIPAFMPPDVGIPMPTVSPEVFFSALVCAGLVAMGSVVLPALRLARLDIAAALSERG